MSTQSAKEFMEKIKDNSEERAKLRKSVAEDVVKAGKAMGYDFTTDDLKGAMSGGGGASPNDVSIGWSS